jgi:hypothetical protein
MLKDSRGTTGVRTSRLWQVKKPNLATLAALAVAFSLGMATSTLWAKHPRIVAAQGHLARAQEELDHAVGEFGGHRVKAIEHIRLALRECEEALLVNP